MRSLNKTLFSAAVLNVTTSSAAIATTQIFNCSVQATTSSNTTGTGTLKLQCSNDVKNPVNWSDITTVAVTATNASFLISKADLCYTFIRVTYVPAVTDATGVMTCVLQALGV